MKDGLLKLKDFPAAIGGRVKRCRFAHELGTLLRLLRILSDAESRVTCLVRSDSHAVTHSPSTDGLIVRKSTTPFTGETISSRMSPNKSPTVPIRSLLSRHPRRDFRIPHAGPLRVKPLKLREKCRSPVLLAGLWS
jgi:hypothetical protein